MTEARQGPQWRRASLSPIRPSHFSEANAGAYARAAQLCGRNAHGTPVSKKLLKTSLRKTEKDCVQEHATSRKNRCTSTQENSEHVVEHNICIYIMLNNAQNTHGSSADVLSACKWRGLQGHIFFHDERRLWINASLAASHAEF